MLKEKPDFDKKDRQILSLFRENPEISQSEIAEKIGISQPSVGVRLKKLRNKGAISHVVGMNFKRVGLYLAKVDLTTKDTSKVLNFFRDCPYFLNGLITSGKYNLCLFFMSEDIISLEAIVDAHLRQNPDVTDIDFNIVISPVSDLVFPVRMNFEKKSVPPCGYKKTCAKCSYYTPEHCLGCPVTGHYRGKLW
jgi:DNA-binding Lrp family transcriptional regulator